MVDIYPSFIENSSREYKQKYNDSTTSHYIQNGYNMKIQPTPRVGVILCREKPNTSTKFKSTSSLCYNESTDEFLTVYQNASRLWGFPKGRLNKFFLSGKEILEDRKIGACRELYEETGVNIDVKNLKCQNMINIKRGNQHHCYFIYRINENVNVNIDGIEIGGYKWMTLSELLKNKKSFFTEQAINKLFYNQYKSSITK